MRLHELFEATAARFPDRIAIDLPPGPGRPHRAQLPYAALLARAQLLAARIAPVAADDAVVAILLGRDTVELYVAQLAVLLAGAAFTCLDPAFPDDHLRGVVADARPVALLTTAAGRERLQAAGITLPVCVDPTTSDDAVIVPARSTDGAPTTAGADAALAYVIYTSGTTGKPKGVQIEHRAIVNLVEGDRAYFGLTSADRVAQCSSPAYDSSIEETWLAFGVGATLVLLDDATVRLGPDLVPWLKQERITVLCPTPTLLRTTGCERPREALPDLALIYIGGEALPQDLADRWAAGRWLENGYGPTECTVTVVRGRIQPGAPITIGQPIPGSTAHLLDEALQPVADGTPGELCIGGVVLARGYAHQPALTAERFPSHPALGRLYRTGDLVRRLPLGGSRVPRTDRRPSQSARLSHRTRRRRSRPHQLPRNSRRRLHRARHRRAAAAGRALRPRGRGGAPRCRRPACAPPRGAAQLHGAGPHRLLRWATNHRWREARP